MISDAHPVNLPRTDFVDYFSLNKSVRAYDTRTRDNIHVKS